MRKRERNVLFNDALNTFYLWLYGVRHMVKDHSDSEREREMFYLTTHSTHFIYGYMASDIWLRTILIVREREMFYLTTHSTHFIYGYMASDIWLRTILIVSERERNVLFNDTLNTFYLRLYDIRHMVNDHSDSEKGNCSHIGYSYQITARVLLYALSHRQDSTYHCLCYTSRGALAETRNSSMGPPHEGSIRRPTAP